MKQYIKKKANHRQLKEFTMFVMPAFILLSICSLIPFLMNIFYAFTNWNGLSLKLKFIGFSNFVEMFTDDRNFLNSVMFTVKFTIVYVVLVNIVAILLAMILIREIRGRSAFRVAIYISNIMSVVILGYMWRFIFTNAFVNIAKTTGLPFFNASFLGNAQNAFWVVVLISAWKSMGFYTVVYITGFMTIPKDLMEVALLDGASGVVKFFKITLPLIFYTITISVFTSLTEAFRSFDLIFSLTSGGPGKSTSNIAFNIYTEAFTNSRFGYGTAESVVFFVIVLLITGLQVKSFKRREVQL